MIAHSKPEELDLIVNDMYTLFNLMREKKTTFNLMTSIPTLLKLKKDK